MSDRTFGKKEVDEIMEAAIAIDAVDKYRRTDHDEVDSKSRALKSPRDDVRLDVKALMEIADGAGITRGAVKHVLSTRFISAEQMLVDEEFVTSVDPEVLVRDILNYMVAELHSVFPNEKFFIYDVWENGFSFIVKQAVFQECSRIFPRLSRMIGIGVTKTISTKKSLFYLDGHSKVIVYSPAILNMFGRFFKERGMDVVRKYSIQR